jgi:TMEM175 potassium channel family protein
VLSFGIVCIWWVAHHHFFILLDKSDRGLLWLNCLFLFWLVAVPFPTALLGDYPLQRVSVICYGAVMTMAGVSFSSMRFYAFYVGSSLALGSTETSCAAP